MASKQYLSRGSGSESSDDLEELLAGCREGSREAQRQLYERFHRQVFGLMVRTVGTQDAADVTQQVFLQLLRKIGKFTGRSQFRTWLFRLATNEGLQHLRRVRRCRTQNLSGKPLEQHASSAGHLEARELLDLALTRLDPELRWMLTLRELEELSYQEIAQCLEIPEGTVGSRLNRARRALRQHLMDLGWEP